MRSAEVARAAGVNVQTLRYYERRGLLPEPSRLESGYRAYTHDAVRIVRFTKTAQGLGFSLEEIAVLLELASGAPDCCEAAHGMAKAKIGELDAKIAALTTMRDWLGRLAATCDVPTADLECPLLGALDHAGDARDHVG